MPEGVSDYAVGGGMMKTMAMPPPYRGNIPMRRQADGNGGQDKSTPGYCENKRSGAPKATLANVTVTGGITKQSAEADQ